MPDPAWVSAYATAYPGYLSIGGNLQFGSGTASSYSGMWLYVVDSSNHIVIQQEIKRSTGDPTGRFLETGAWCYGWWAANSYPANQCFWWASNQLGGALQDGKQYYAWIFMEGTDGSTSPSGTTSPLVTAFYTPDIPGSQVGICSCYGQTDRADPVNTATGTYFEKATDASLVGAGKPLTLDRYYRSDSSATGLLGRGWSTPFDSKLTLTSTDATLLTADGSKVSFLKLNDGTYATHVGAFLKLTVSGSTYTVTGQDHSASVFDSSGRLTGLRDASGHGLSLSYASGHLASITDAAGRSTAFTVGSDGLLTKVTLPDATTVGYGYTSGLLTSATDPAGKTTSYGYDSAQRLTTVTDPTGAKITNVYGTNGRVSSQTDPNGKKTTFTWDGSRTSNTTDADGGVWSDVYSGNVLLDSIDPYGNEVSYDYDQDLHPIDITDRLGNTTTMTYDNAGNMLTRTAPSSVGYSESWTYDSAGNVHTHTDGRGNTTTYTYNAANQVATVTDPAGGKVTYTYTPLGALDSVTTPRGKKTTYGYDAAGNRTSVTTPLGEKTTFTYDAAGHVLTRTDPRGNVSGADPAAYTTTYTYDPRGLLSSVTDPLGHVTGYGYNDAGQLTTVTDAAGHTTTYTYDPAGNVKTTTDPAGKVTTDTYDSAGNLASVTDPLGNTTTYTYDKNGLLLSTVSPRGNVTGANKAAFTTSYGYDANGNRTTVTDPSGATTVTGYDALNRVVSVTDPLGHVTKTSYDGNDNLATTTDPLGKVTRYTYDAADRQKTQTDPLGKVTAYGYDADGNRTSTTSPLGFITSWTYDSDGRMLTQVDPRGNVSGATASQYTTTYGYDAAGNQTTVTDPLGKVTVTAYDADNHPVSVTDPLGHVTKTDYNELGAVATVTGPDGAATTYTYNATGTLHTRTDPNGHTTTYGYDDAGRQKSVTDPLGRVQGFGYDADGNPTTVTDARGITATTTFDGRNLPSGTTYSDSTPATGYTYFADGHPKTVTDGTGTRTFGYDLDGRLASVTPSAGKGAFAYTYDADGRIASRAQDYTPGTALDWSSAVQTASADLNGDGISDVIRTDAKNGIRTYLGRPDGTFTTGATLTGSGTGFKQILPIEYTGDGKTDLLAIDKSTGHLFRYNGDGKGGFAAPVDMGGGWGVMTLTAGDFNGDGTQDFLAISSSANEMYFYPGKGDGTFGTRTAVGPGWATYRLTALDYNGDGTLDVLAINSAVGHLYFYPGKGDGTLGARTDLGQGWGAFQLTPGDFTGDGKADFAADDTSGHHLYVYPGTGSGTFSARILQADDWTSYGIPVTGTFDAGTTLDIAAPDTAGHLRWWSGDGAGHLTGATLATGPASGQKTTYGYDDDSRQTSQTGPAGTIAYAYDPAGNLTATTLPAANGYVEKRTYDTAGRLASIGSTKGTTTLANWKLTLNDDGLPSRVDATRAGKPASYQYYTYDPDGRLLTDCTSATAAAQCPDTTTGTAYTYDGAGNRKTATTGGTTTTYSYDDADQLTTATTGTTTRSYSYDKDGNQTGDGTNTFAYNATNHLTSLTTPSATFTYGYDADGNRVTASKTGTGLQRTTVWDPNNSLPQAAADYNGSGTLTATYQYNPLEQIQSQTLPTGAAYFQHHDQLGSVTDLTDNTGTPQTSWTYTAYGQATATNTATNPPANPFTYTGQYTDPTTPAAGYDLRARNYDPTTGRFTSTDPIGLRQNQPYTSAYAYAGDAPTYATDPSGQDWLSPITSRIKAIGSGLKEGAELPFTVIGDLGDAVTGRNGGAGGFLDKYLPIRPAYRLYRAADMLRKQGCDQLADQYDAAADQLTQQILLVGLGGLEGWEKDAVAPGTRGHDIPTVGKGVGPARIREPGGRTDQPVIAGHGVYFRGTGDTEVPNGTWAYFYVEDGKRLSQVKGIAIEKGEKIKPTEIFRPGSSMPDYTVLPGSDLRMMERSITVSKPTRLSEILKPGMGPVHIAICREHCDPR
ncbi:FG-GAP-like repeat-containing protein [Streptomyces sp. HPF1205]|uniref:FG-GAP-like repeat-containing protein n=1 Tax=Streptomyces sp. HPF1205 TaxID=2873262 RepID=UPI0027E0DD94|nr:FG-GAP-like repeat-containing protein [Streptomyces sp. HPF1205]